MGGGSPTGTEELDHFLDEQIAYYRALAGQTRAQQGQPVLAKITTTRYSTV
jgi:hypothetical protein